MSLRNQLFSRTLMSEGKKKTGTPHNISAWFPLSRIAFELCCMSVFFLHLLIRVLVNSWFLKLIEKGSIFFKVRHTLKIMFSMQEALNLIKQLSVAQKCTIMEKFTFEKIK